jgi:hypothetical protein
MPAMQRIAIASFVALGLACTPPAPASDDSKQAPSPANKMDVAPTDPVPAPPKPKPEIVRKDLVAEELPPVPTLEQLELTPEASGQFAWPEGTDEILPRAAVAITDGLLLAGQLYNGRVPGKPTPPTWAWLGVVANDGAARSTKLGEGAVRAAISDGKGNALLAGFAGAIRDARGWFAIVDAHGEVELQVTLQTQAVTELFDLIPGSSEAELAIVAGYVDAQAWLVSLDRGAAERWQKFVGSYGYSQPRALTRLDHELLLVGTRSQQFGESWWARVPADGGADPSGADVTQAKLEIAGADQHQSLRAIVRFADGSSIAIGTGKRNYIQDHDQLLAVGFDAGGAPTWSKVIADVRVTESYGAQAVADVAKFVVGVPGAKPDAPAALALVEIGKDGSATVKQIAGTDSWQSAGMVEAAATPALIGYVATNDGMAWRRWPI